MLYHWHESIELTIITSLGIYYKTIFQFLFTVQTHNFISRHKT